MKATFTRASGKLPGFSWLAPAAYNDAIFIFQIGSTLITASGSKVDLTGGAQASNVFWQVGSSATLGTLSTLAGNILALASITVTTGVTIDGRALARNGAVTLDTDSLTGVLGNASYDHDAATTVGTVSIASPNLTWTGNHAIGGTASAALGDVQVTDNRAALAVGWTATVSCTGFTTGGGSAAETIPASDARYLISGFTATAGLAAVPSGAVAGTYSATITYSAA